jgi:hypothetical protein
MMKIFRLGTSRVYEAADGEERDPQRRLRKGTRSISVDRPRLAINGHLKR